MLKKKCNEKETKHRAKSFFVIIAKTQLLLFLNKCCKYKIHLNSQFSDPTIYLNNSCHVLTVQRNSDYFKALYKPEQNNFS